MLNYVYSLRNADTQECYYVGVTVNPKQRLREHLTTIKTCGGTNMYRCLKCNNIWPIMRIEFVCWSRISALLKEAELIRGYRKVFKSVLNTFPLDKSYCPELVADDSVVGGKRSLVIRFDKTLLKKIDTFIKKHMPHKDRTEFLHDASNEHLRREKRKVK